MANYTNQAAIEARIGRTLTEGEVTYLSTLLPAIDEFINSQTGTTFLPPSPDDDVTIYEVAQCSGTLVIPTMRSITAVSVSTGFDDDFILLPSTEWRVYPRSGPILAIERNGSWGDDTTTVQIIGKTGYLTVPYDIASIAGDLAVSAIIASSINSSNTENYKSERVDLWQVTYADNSSTANSNNGISSISSTAMNVLDGYNRLSRRI